MAIFDAKSSFIFTAGVVSKSYSPLNLKKKKQPVRFLTGVSCFTTLGWRGRVKARPGQSAVKCEELLASNIHFHLQFVFTK